MNSSASFPLDAHTGQSIASVADLASRIGMPAFDAIRKLYDIHEVSTSRLLMNTAGWAVTSEVMKLPRDAVENQVLTMIRDRFTGHEAIINSLRAKRKVDTDGADQVSVSASGPIAAQCRWCREWHVRESAMWADEWGQIVSADRRIGTRPNWARQSAISALAFGDERMHCLESLTESEFVGLFDIAERYLGMARHTHPDMRFCTLFLNGGPKSASSVEHAHVQIVARGDRHFAYPEIVAARCPPDYWQRLSDAHAQAGLTITQGACAAWVSLAPVKEKDITALSPSVIDGAQFIYRIWRDLAHEGTRNFSLAAILSPGHVTGSDCPERFAQWPKVVWRFVDRGSPEVAHGDIGTMELFGSSIVASDPFIVAGTLQRSAAGGRGTQPAAARGPASKSGKTGRGTR